MELSRGKITLFYQLRVKTNFWFVRPLDKFINPTHILFMNKYAAQDLLTHVWTCTCFKINSITLLNLVFLAWITYEVRGTLQRQIIYQLINWHRSHPVHYKFIFNFILSFSLRESSRDLKITHKFLLQRYVFLFKLWIWIHPILNNRSQNQ